ncbi:MAG: hypothetical protein H6R10_624 [Rhodocyclaceae bacterium]|nr:hypothetical protein [Rhodocyclaceae bacterium]
MPNSASKAPLADRSGEGGHAPLVWAFVPLGADGWQVPEDSYDSAQYKAELALAFQRLGLPWIWQPVRHGTVDQTVAQALESSRRHEVVVFNFCDGTDDPSDTPGLSVVHALERAGLRFTGADSGFYRISTSKVLMKSLLQEAGVATAPFAVVPNSGPVDGIGDGLAWPLFCKPDVSAGSYGISLRSVVHSSEELHACREGLKTGPFAQLFAESTFLAEQFIDGPEFTVFVGGHWDRPETIWSLVPAQRVFHGSIPPGERFLSFDRYLEIYEEESPPPGGEKFFWYERCPPEVEAALCDLATRAYRAVRGRSYGRVDIRQDARTGRFYVLEVNANCGLSGSEGSSMGNILRLAGLDFAGLMGRIIEDA